MPKRQLTPNEQHRQRLYGLTPFQYRKLLRNQNGVCAICKEINDDGRSLAVDHDHYTGKVRGLLCTRCNLGLGFFKDEIRLLAEAIVYLEDAGYSY